jgi:hypothetical protein
MKLGFLNIGVFFIQKPLALKAMSDTLSSPYGCSRSKRKQAAKKVNVRG